MDAFGKKRHLAVNSIISQFFTCLHVGGFTLQNTAQIMACVCVNKQVMWKAVERAVGCGFDREKCEVKLVGTPLTHQRFLRRNRGTYGPAIQAGENTFPGHSTPIPKLLCCGDSTFPGIGVPAVAASGAIVANSLVSVSQHSELLDAVGI